MLGDLQVKAKSTLGCNPPGTLAILTNLVGGYVYFPAIPEIALKKKNLVYSDICKSSSRLCIPRYAGTTKLIFLEDF